MLLWNIIEVAREGSSSQLRAWWRYKSTTYLYSTLKVLKNIIEKWVLMVWMNVKFVVFAKHYSTMIEVRYSTIYIYICLQHLFIEELMNLEDSMLKYRIFLNISERFFSFPSQNFVDWKNLYIYIYGVQAAKIPSW